MSEAQSDLDGQVHLIRELIRLPPNFTSKTSWSVFHCVAELVVCAINEIHKLRSNDVKHIFLVSLLDLMRAAGTEASAWPVAV
jgi:hypothetical protein